MAPRRPVQLARASASVSLHVRTANRAAERIHPIVSARQEAMFEPLHARYAPLALEVIRNLRGFYIKLGQIGATRSDFVAPQYIRRCAF